MPIYKLSLYSVVKKISCKLVIGFRDDQNISFTTFM